MTNSLRKAVPVFIAAAALIAGCGPVGTPVAPASPRPAPSSIATVGDSRPRVAAQATASVTRIIDGDTLTLDSGDIVRIVGIDTPERGQCGYQEASDNLKRLALGKAVNLAAPARRDSDRYGRLLRYVNVGKVDAGLDQITRGYAHARYDSRDGYGRHPREAAYVAADAQTTHMCEGSAR